MAETAPLKTVVEWIEAQDCPPLTPAQEAICQAVSDGMAKAGGRDTAGRARLTDAYGNWFFEVGDLVTRDGTDIHRVVDHNGSDGYPPDGMTVVCVKAPSEPWTQVGEEEFNVCRRYEWVGDVIEGDLPAVGSFHG